MAEGSKTAEEVFKKTLPKLINTLWKDPLFTVVTATLYAEGLITKQELEAIKTKQGVERGSEVAFKLTDKIKASDDPTACLLTICEIFESDDVENDTLKKHGASMRESISNGTTATPQVSSYPPIVAPRTNPNKLSASDRFRRVSDRLVGSISSCLTTVSGKLNARRLIAQELHDEMINGCDIDSKKAAKLVHAMQNTLYAHANPETYLNDMCSALKDVGEVPITDIVNELQ
ncbi:PREDICTED: uncharacterized protein LOC109586279 [Amphimedon queenslandica]|nr:PREDICTED: uncharacterized protein LOC109586279 [Amphimedon queenslandica]|eukprot:XP_019858013.1 PREDICTED: uncharacterized protein LOC109586279 [Amphimedon queenslandica]